MDENRADDRLKPFVPLVQFLGESLGECCEVVLHDTRDSAHSIVAIANGHVSGRQVGGSLTDLAIRMINEKWHLNVDYVVNYPGRTSGGKSTRSSTMFIKDDRDNLIGMLCINIDVSEFIKARDAIDRLIRVASLQYPHGGGNSQGEEYLTGTVEDLMHAIINEILDKSDVPPDRMTPNEKMEVVRALNQKGVFLLRGAVATVAEHLETSESTIYRYLNMVENETCELNPSDPNVRR